MKHIKKYNGKIIILIAIVSGLILSSILYSIFLRGYISKNAQAANSLESYCQNGIYNIPQSGGSISCGRAPDCGGKTYADVETIAWSNQTTSSCWLVEGDRCAKTCKGYVPLCCYEIERTGDPLKCTWPERGYCHPQQCAHLTTNLCGGGDCHCGGPIVTWCKDIDHCITSADQIPYRSLSERLGGTPAPTSAATSAPTTAPTSSSNATPTPTSGSSQNTSLSKSKLGVFILDTYTAGAKKIVEAGTPVVKFLDPQLSQTKLDAIKKYKETYPNGTVVVRFFHTQGSLAACETGHMRTDCVTDKPDEYAKIYYDKVEAPGLNAMGDYKKYVDYITGPNEFEDLPYPWEINGEASTQQRAVDRQHWNATFWLKFSQLMHDNFNNMKTCILSIPTAAMGAKEFSTMLPELEEIRKIGGSICYHEYPEIASKTYKNIYNYFNSSEVKSSYPQLASIKMILGEGGKKNWQGSQQAITDYENYLVNDLDKDLQTNPNIIGITLFQIGNGSTWARSDYEPIADWLANYLKGNLAQVTSAPTTGAGTTAPTTAVEPTRPAGSCTTPEIPGIKSPIGGGAYPGKVKIVWNPVNTAKTYALRIDDVTNPWNSNCTSPNSGDLCVNDIPKSTTSYEFTGVEGHTYHFWIHSINYCGEWSKSNDSGVTTGPPRNAGECTIQGYRTLIGPIDQASLSQHWGYNIDKVNQNNSLTLWVPDSIRTQVVTAQGSQASIKYYNFNPYYLIVKGGETYNVSIAPVSGYNVSSTLCINDITCHGELSNNTHLQNGASRTVTCPVDSYVDLWWNFTPDTIPTIALSPTAGPTPTAAPPTPTACPAIPALAWREGETHYTRTVVSYDGTGGNVVETISLHLKQITQSGVIVEASTDGGSTWAASESSENDDHFITIKNRNSEVINLQVRLTDACTQTSTVLTEDVATVPLPSAAMTVTPTGTSGTGGSLSPATIAAIAAAVVAALIAAGYLTGM